MKNSEPKYANWYVVVRGNFPNGDFTERFILCKGGSNRWALRTYIENRLKFKQAYTVTLEQLTKENVEVV